MTSYYVAGEQYEGIGEVKFLIPMGRAIPVQHFELETFVTAGTGKNSTCLIRNILIIGGFLYPIIWYTV